MNRLPSYWLFLITFCLPNLCLGPTPFSHLISTLPARIYQEIPWHPLFDERFPRLLTLVLSGAALSTAGLITQTLFRNPLGSPGILGISSGASLATTLIVILQGPHLYPTAIPFSTLVGGLGCLLLIKSIANKRSTHSLLLTGIAISTFLLAIQQCLIYCCHDNWTLQRTLHEWTTGSSLDRQWLHVHLSAPLIILGFILTRKWATELDLLSLGDEEAQILGVDVHRVRQELIFAVALLVGGSTAALGHLPFLGLIVPHMVRQMNLPQHRHLFPKTALVGAIILLIMDLLLRHLLPLPLQLGHLTSLTGACLLLILVRKTV